MGSPSTSSRVKGFRFPSGDAMCAASLYRAEGPTDKVPCLVMAHGFTGTRDQLRSYAERFAAGGITVLTFDYRHFGDSDGQPRQIVRTSNSMTGEQRSGALAPSMVWTRTVWPCGGPRCRAVM